MKRNRDAFKNKAEKGIVLVRGVQGKIEIGIHGGRIDSFSSVRSSINIEDSLDLKEEATIIIAEYGLADALSLSVAITQEVLYQKMLDNKLYDEEGFYALSAKEKAKLIEEALDAAWNEE